MINLSELSLENLIRIQKILKIILDELELQGINELAGNKIPLKIFEKEGFSYEEIETLFYGIDKEKNIISINNKYLKEAYEKTKRQQPFLGEADYKEIFLKAYGVPLEDLENHLLFTVKNLNELKVIKERVDKKLTEFEKKQRQPRKVVELFTKEVVPDRTAEIRKQMDEARRWEVERWEREKLHREQMKQDRILRTSVDKYTHALDLIIERAEFAGDGNNFSIDFYDFNFEKMIGLRMLEKFLTEMQKNNCFEEYAKTNYSGGTRFSFIKVNIKNLKKFGEKNKKVDTKKEELLKLSPEIYGIGINLKVLTNKCKMFWNKLIKKFTKQ